MANTLDVGQLLEVHRLSSRTKSPRSRTEGDSSIMDERRKSSERVRSESQTPPEVGPYWKRNIALGKRRGSTVRLARHGTTIGLRTGEASRADEPLTSWGVVAFEADKGEFLTAQGTITIPDPYFLERLADRGLGATVRGLDDISLGLFDILPIPRDDPSKFCLQYQTARRVLVDRFRQKGPTKLDLDEFVNKWLEMSKLGCVDSTHQGNYPLEFRDVVMLKHKSTGMYLSALGLPKLGREEQILSSQVDSEADSESSRVLFVRNPGVSCWWRLQPEARSQSHVVLSDADDKQGALITKTGLLSLQHMLTKQHLRVTPRSTGGFSLALGGQYAAASFKLSTHGTRGTPLKSDSSFFLHNDLGYLSVLYPERVVVRPYGDTPTSTLWSMEWVSEGSPRAGFRIRHQTTGRYLTVRQLMGQDDADNEDVVGYGCAPMLPHFIFVLSSEGDEPSNMVFTAVEDFLTVHHMGNYRTGENLLLAHKDTDTVLHSPLEPSPGLEFVVPFFRKELTAKDSRHLRLESSVADVCMLTLLPEDRCDPLLVRNIHSAFDTLSNLFIEVIKPINPGSLCEAFIKDTHAILDRLMRLIAKEGSGDVYDVELVDPDPHKQSAVGNPYIVTTLVDMVETVDDYIQAVETKARANSKRVKYALNMCRTVSHLLYVITKGNETNCEMLVHNFPCDVERVPRLGMLGMCVPLLNVIQFCPSFGLSEEGLHALANTAFSSPSERWLKILIGMCTSHEKTYPATQKIVATVFVEHAPIRIRLNGAELQISFKESGVCVSKMAYQPFMSWVFQRIREKNSRMVDNLELLLQLMSAFCKDNRFCAELLCSTIADGRCLVSCVFNDALPLRIRTRFMDLFMTAVLPYSSLAVQPTEALHCTSMEHFTMSALSRSPEFGTATTSCGIGSSYKNRLLLPPEEWEDVVAKVIARVGDEKCLANPDDVLLRFLKIAKLLVKGGVVDGSTSMNELRRTLIVILLFERDEGQSVMRTFSDDLEYESGFEKGIIEQIKIQCCDVLICILECHDFSNTNQIVCDKLHTACTTVLRAIEARAGRQRLHLAVLRVACRNLKHVFLDTWRILTEDSLEKFESVFPGFRVTVMSQLTKVLHFIFGAMNFSVPLSPEELKSTRFSATSGTAASPDYSRLISKLILKLNTYCPYLTPGHFTKELREERVLHRYQQKIFLTWIQRKASLNLSDLDPKLDHLPLEVGLCEDLLQLNVANNAVKALPCVIGKLTNLRELVLSNNALTGVPAELSQMRNLRVLDLKSNQINTLPPTLGYMPNLLTLNLARNPLKELPSGFEKRKLPDMLEYLRNLRVGTVESRAIRFVVLGENGVGKSSVLSGFIDRSCHAVSSSFADLYKAAKRNVRVVETTDMRQYHWEASSKDVPPVNVTALDFSRSTNRYSTHRYYLHPESLYAVVFDVMRVEDACLDEWLRTVIPYVEDSPVVLIGTHTDDKNATRTHLDTMLAGLKSRFSAKYPKITHLLLCSPKSGRGMPELTSTLLSIMDSQPAMNMKIPNSQLELEKQVELRGFSCAQLNTPPLYSWDEFVGLAESAGVDPGMVDTIATRLNNLGVLTLCGRKGLPPVVACDPHYLASAVFALGQRTANERRTALYHRDSTVGSTGMLWYQDIVAVWDNTTRFLGCHDTLLDVLVGFQVAHVLANELYFLYDLLSAEMPYRLRRDWPEWTEACHTVERRYRFRGAFPPSFFPHLLVWVLRTFGKKMIAIWRYGVLLGMEDGKLLIRVDPSTATIVVSHRARGCPSSMPADTPAIRDSLSRRPPKPTSSTANDSNSPSMAHSFYSILSSVHLLVQEVFSLTDVVREVVCTHCLQGNLQPPSIFLMADLQQLYLEGKPGALCDVVAADVDAADSDYETLSSQLVPLGILVPDVTLCSANLRKIDPATELSGVELIGQGGFAKVYKAVWENPTESEPCQVAIKELLLGPSDPDMDEEPESGSLYDEFRCEVWTMSFLKHRNIVRLHGIVLRPLSIIMEYISEGNLEQYYQNRENDLPAALRLDFALDIARGMHYLHHITPPVVHRDLKAANVLLGREGGKLVCKLADFGTAVWGVAAGSLKRRVVDNPVWCAPEVLRGDEYDSKVDVYSYGVILWEMLARKRFFEGEGFWWKIEDKVINGERPDIPPCRVEYRSLIEGCWDNNPDSRPTWEPVITLLLVLKGMVNQ